MKKLFRSKLTLLLLAALLMSSCSATSSGINATFIALIVRILPFSAGYFASNPVALSDGAVIDVWAAESASGTALSNFLFNSGPIMAMPVPVLTGVRAGGITEYYGLNEATSTMYLWGGGTVYILTGNNGTATQTGSITVAPGIQNFIVDPSGNFGYATAAGSTKLYIADLKAKTVSKMIDFGQGAIPNATAAWQDPNTGLTTVYVVDSAGSYHTVDPTTGSYTTTTFPNQGVIPGKPAVLPEGSQLWIPYPASILIFDTQSNTIVNVIDSPNFTEVLFSPDGTSAYLLNSGGSISSVSTKTLKPNWQRTIGRNPQGLALSPYGTFLLVANSGDGDIEQISTADGSVMSTTDVGTTPVGAVAFNE
jgi:DNA-binding beta-propeller fold protein YncE